MSFNPEYELIKAGQVNGRYITNERVNAFLSSLSSAVKVEVIGSSVLGRPIKTIEIGTGTQRILMWSQMHGNESTTTKAVLDLVNYLQSGNINTNRILRNCTIKIVPILNPDGAEAYTRVNANQVDLNRDAQDLSQPESNVLRQLFNSFQPAYCFNLHDQRTIYNVGDSTKPASVSFLSPSVDDARTITPSRATAMQLIVAMNEILQKIVPGQVGRYDDAHNLNCVGDTFQTLGSPTVLFEAGHFKEDYQREISRKLIFEALLTATTVISNESILDFNVRHYLEIPENGKQFFDVLIKNISSYDPNYKAEDAVGILFEEVLKNESIAFLPKIEKVGALDSFIGHKTYDCEKEEDLLELRKQTQLCSIINNN